MYSYTGTTCPKCGQPHTVPNPWLGITPPPVSCGCPVKSNTVIFNLINK